MRRGAEVFMIEKRTEAADADRRRFLILAAKLGIAVPPVVILTLAKPSYAAGARWIDLETDRRGYALLL
jgi:hypothetical protein